ncbi:MAG: DNA polymerase III subunit gamma/tau [Calditrichaceae bacterium]|nr:DNA polymerase III subunit gamma/tau [Calditrichia bacterium]NUQ43741.1 DNA polymerase III subunit gamma/tau [Calditrichaceae bacterium]
MAYIVLARKWRPLTFEDVAGQEHVTRTLMNALQQQRMGHAFIFAGPRGVGKTTAARLLAKALNCETQPAINPCNQCKSCKAVTEGHSLDVIEIDGASNRGIDEIRNLRENIRFSPASSRYKVYIIDEVHMLSKEAFNALLKTLEEPPAHAVFIFATTEIHRVPLTILSRCQRFDFKRIPTAVIADRLQQIAEFEKIPIDRDGLLLISRKAEGSMRDATSILDQLASSSAETLTVEKVQEALGLINEELFFEFTDLIPQKEDAAVIRFARAVFEQGHDLVNFLHGLEEHFRNLLIARATGSTQLLETSDYFKNLYQEKAPLFAEKDLLHYIDILTQNEALLKYSENPQLILELLLLKLVHKPLSVALEELLELLKNLPDSPAPAGSIPPAPNPGPQPGAPTPPPQPPSSSAPAMAPFRSAGDYPSSVKEPSKGRFDSLKKNSLPASPAPSTATETETTVAADVPPVNLADVSGRWNELIAAIKKEKIALSSFLQDGVPYKVEGRMLQIAFDPKTGFHMDHVQKNASMIERVMAQELGMPLRIKCIKVQFEQEGIQRQVQTPEEAFESMKNKEPVLKKIIELFDCENMDE